MGAKKYSLRKYRHSGRSMGRRQSKTGSENDLKVRSVLVYMPGEKRIY